MSGVIKSYIGKEDFQIPTNTNAPELFQRLMSVGGTMNLTKMPDIWNGMGRIDLAEVDTTTIYASDIIITGPALESFVFGTPMGAPYPTLFDVNTSMSTTGSSLIQAMLGIRGEMVGTAQDPIGLDTRLRFLPSTNIDMSCGISSNVSTLVPAGAAQYMLCGMYTATGTLDSPGALTYSVGLYVEEAGWYTAGFGTLKPTNSIGVQIENQGAAGVTNAYGISVAAQSGASTINLSGWFGGDVGFGSKLFLSAINVSGPYIWRDLTYGDDLAFKTNGYLKFGTYVSMGAEAFAGYVYIRDSGGTLRKLMVCA